MTGVVPASDKGLATCQLVDTWGTVLLKLITGMKNDMQAHLDQSRVRSRVGFGHRASQL